MRVYREITPLDKKDVFIIMNSVENCFDYPIHNHPEFEINLVMGSSGTRIVGDSTDRYTGTDLVLLGPFLYHKWDGSNAPQLDRTCRVITVQFGMQLFDAQILSKEPFTRLRNFLRQSGRGIRFYGNTLEKARRRMIGLTKYQGLESVIEFLRLLDLLSGSGERHYLASEGFQVSEVKSDRERIEVAYKYILDNFQNHRLRISDVASRINMSDSSFSHYFKKNTNRSYTRFLLNIRLGHACKLLINTDRSIGAISYDSGFNNTANFNRLFKKYRGCTPKEFRHFYLERTDFDWTTQMTPYQFIPSEVPLEQAVQARKSLVAH